MVRAHVLAEALGPDAGHMQEQGEGGLILPALEGRARGGLGAAGALGKSHLAEAALL